MTTMPTFNKETEHWHQGMSLVAGIDEVGRGPLAGPVVAASVVFAEYSNFPWLSSIRDSKELSPAKREHLSTLITDNAIGTGIGLVDHQTIDNIGIAPATRQAMVLAVNNLSFKPDQLLIDAMLLPDVLLPQESIIKGDRISISIASASIVAKVFRDRIMLNYDREFQGYNFAKNKGYGTKEHLAALRSLGASPIHRRSFAPLKNTL